MLQFLAEAAILTIMGGLIGIVLGIAGGHVICAVIGGSMGTTITPGISLGNHPGGNIVLLCSRCILRNLPGKKSSQTQPHRGTEKKLENCCFCIKNSNKKYF